MSSVDPLIAALDVVKGYRTAAGYVPILAGVNLAVQAQDWSTQRIIRELRPAVLATCADISALLSDTSAGSL